MGSSFSSGISNTNPSTILIALILIILLVLFVFWLVNKQGTNFSGESSTSQEVPSPTLPPGVNPVGQVNASLNRNNTALTYSAFLRDSNDPITQAHFHRGERGVAGPIVKTLNFVQENGNWVIKGTWSNTDPIEPLTPALVQDLLQNRIYINWHTSANPDGESRGQLYNRG